MDLFESKNIKPMLIGEMQEAFDSPDHIYELKLDGIRCIAYLGKNSTDLRNKRNIKILTKFPELAEIHKQVNCRCILDGELIVMKDGKPDFHEVQPRTLMSNTFKIKLAAAKLPASFTVYDILYYDDHDVIDLPLMERKKLLQKVIKENERIAISRFIEEHGIDLYQLTVENQLAGIIAKSKDSKYYLGRETKDWIKTKNLNDEDFIVCGYIVKKKGIISIVIGQYSGTQLVYQGHVTMEITNQNFKLIKTMPIRKTQPFKVMPEGNDNAVWIAPSLICIVQYMVTPNNSVRQAVFKGLRDDKSPKDCTV